MHQTDPHVGTAAGQPAALAAPVNTDKCAHGMKDNFSKLFWKLFENYVLELVDSYFANARSVRRVNFSNIKLNVDQGEGTLLKLSVSQLLQ